MYGPIKDQVHIIAQELQEMIIELFPEHITDVIESVIEEEAED